ncbi:hypothetical protein BJ322DRAFT_1108085 [Thelephora terrestris]|uniref:RING-type domain-containing protein n=1 Tax=Thelephora terrestris TaxID=56493 RepID=A0A9P6HFL5_9AGAM|nr:hypothetical protein BJ322DRAFT_1108085 [Thelephora terrestris]
MTSRKDRVRQHFAASMSKQEGSSPTEHHPILGPTRPVLDRAQEIKAKQLEEDFNTVRRGFIKLRDKYTQSTTTISTLETELSASQGESEQLRAQIAALREELRAQHEATTAAGIAAATSTRTVRGALKQTAILTELTEKVKCMVCLEVCGNPYSMDCRHAFCGPCIASWFATVHNSTCPECRTACVGYPQRDFALRGVIQMVHSGLEQGVSTYENFDPAIFVQIYSMIEVCRASSFSAAEKQAFWAPMIAEIQRMRGVVISDDVNGGASSNVNDPINVDNMPGNGADNPIDVDVEMGGDVEGSVWEGGSGVDSGESESETDGV